MRGLFILLAILVVAIGVYTLWPPRPEVAPVVEPDPEPTPLASVGEWAGSGACKECHPRIYDRWSKTTHARTLNKFGTGAVARPFDGDRFEARGFDHQMGPDGDMLAEGPGGDPQRFKVDTIIGVRRVQMFTTKMDKGRIQVLPVFLEIDAKKWFDYTDFIFGVPDDVTIPPDNALSWYGPHRNYNSRCGRCHETNYKIGYDADEGSYETTSIERAISCENCHGAAGAHVDKWRREEPGPDPIVNPVKLPLERSNHVCGQCHAEGRMVRTGFKPGDDLFDFVDVAGLDDAIHLLPDGKPSELIHALVPTMMSRCGPIACTKCHDPHGRGHFADLYDPLPSDKTCTQCHEDIGRNLEAHTHHKPESDGSRCIHCHMPKLVIEGGHGKVADHTISIPSSKNTAELALPNACRTCHVLDYPGFEEEPFAKWYPDAEKNNHRVELAAAIDGGRQRKPEARDGLLALARDENPVYRAGAVFALAGYGVDLRPHLADSHVMVRRAAVWGVANRYPAAIEPLVDGANYVLQRAAVILLTDPRWTVAYAHLVAHPELQPRIQAALDRLLAERNDDALLWLAQSRLHELAGKKTEAAASLTRYRLLAWD